MAVLASKSPYNSRPLLKTGVSGEFRYFGSVQHSPAEANHIALHGADREHDAVAEAVVALPIRRGIFGLVGDYQAALLKQRVVIPWKGASQRAPAVRRVANRETRGDLAAEAALLQVGDRARTGLELLAIVVRCLRQHIGQVALPVLELGRALALFGSAIV